MTRTRRQPKLKRACGKTRYPDDQSAKAALRYFREMKAADPQAVVPVRAYKCKACKGYHITKIEVWREPPRFTDTTLNLVTRTKRHLN